MGNKCLVDANIFITAYRRLYPFDLAPSFWEQLIEKASHRILIIEQVDQEIRKGKDVLSQWYEDERSKFTILGQPSSQVLESCKAIINWVNGNQRYTQSAKDEFASSADLWLCAHGLALQETIATLETYDPEIKKRVKILQYLQTVWHKVH
jgi:hypothetical protein